MSNNTKPINYDKREVPTSPGPKQITTVGTEYKKGSSPMTSKLPTEYVVPGSTGKK